MRVRLIDIRALEPRQPRVSETAPVPALCEEELARGARDLAEEEHAQLLARERAESRASAEKLVKDAQAEAASLLDQAKTEAAAITAEAERVGAEKAEAMARAAVDEAKAGQAATWLALRTFEERSAQRQLDRVVALAAIVTERVLGRALETDAGVATSLARQALSEIRDARTVHLEANPLDASELHAALTDGGLSPSSGLAVGVAERRELPRGCFRMRTELGGIEANLSGRIERLALALRDVLHPSSC